LVGRTYVVREERVEGGGVEFGRGTEPREPSVVDEDVHITGLLGELGHVVGVGQLVGNALAVAYWFKGRTVISLMNINADGSLSGRWLRRTDRGSKGTETWTKE